MNLQRRPMVLGSLAALAAPGALLAQQPAPGKVWRIGVLSLSIPAEPVGMTRLIVWALAPLGYELGRNLQIDYKFAQGKTEALPKLAADLIDAKPDLLIGLLINDGLALKRATTTIPIVMMYATLPVELGLIKSLANPGGNITGTASVSPELWAKTFQIMRELIPQATHVAYFFDPEFPGMILYLQQIEHAARSLGIRLSKHLVRNVADIDSALSNLLRDRPHAVNVGMAGVIIEHVEKVIEFAARNKLPTHYSIAEPVSRGGLISYAPNFFAMARRNAWMIDRIFNGAKPADIPMEEPARFSLVINMKTARAMGLVIPPTVLLQATELIE